MKFRILTIVGVMALALGLVGITLALAQDGAPAPTAPTEAEREAAAAAAMEANPPAIARASTVFTPPAVISAPLFVGVDEPNEFTYLVDPVTSDAYPLFDGFDVWGAAFDAANRRIFFALGTPLAVWPLDGSPGSLGLVRSAASSQPLAIAGLAYHEGMLYGSRTVASAADPEAIYLIDPVTLSATVHITYSVPTTQVDIGGLAVDPATGDLYGTNDTAALRGLVRIGPDGSITVVAPYPAGQNDIDGLAIGDGRAYLVTDQPGDFYVFDFATLTYTTPITNPWTTSELFAGAAWITAPAVLTPSITLTKTVGLDPNECAKTASLTLTETMDVTYCYEVLNTGDVTLTHHSLEDSALGNILDDLAYDLSPEASAFVTQTVSITQTTVNTATWTAYNPGPTDTVSATAAATVTVPVVETAPDIAVTPASLSADLIPTGQITAGVTISNDGDADLTWTAFFAPFECTAPGALLWAAVDPTSGTTAPGASSNLTVTFSAAGSPLGELMGVLCVASNDPDEPVVAVPLALTIHEIRSLLPIIYRP